MNKVFIAVRCPEDRKVEIAKYFLASDASKWCDAVGSKDRIVTWEEFQEVMETEYSPWPVQEAKILAFYEAQPQNIPVSQAIIEYNRELFYVKDQVKEERDKIRHFDRRMKPHIRYSMARLSCATLKEYQSRALAFDMSRTATEIMVHKPPRN